ncbi:MAG: hypothetical protein ACRC5R_01330, partial [Mycoplasmatales bacterium]
TIKKNFSFYKKLILVIAFLVILFFVETFILNSPLIYKNITTWVMLILYVYSMVLKSKYLKMINVLIKNDDAKYGKNNVISRKLATFKFEDEFTADDFIKYMKI